MLKRLSGIVFGLIAVLVLAAGCGLVYKEDFFSTVPEDGSIGKGAVADIVEDAESMSVTGDVSIPPTVE